MWLKNGKKDLLMTCYMKRLFTTDLDTLATKERMKVFEPITNLAELKKNIYLVAMCENMLIYDIRNRIKIGKNYREHRVKASYNLIEVLFVKERGLLFTAGCDGLLVLWKVCFKEDIDAEKLELMEDEVPSIFLTKIQKVKFNSEKICRIFSVIYRRHDNKIMVCNETNKIYVFNLLKKKPKKTDLIESVEVLNAAYIIRNFEYDIAGMFDLEEYDKFVAFHWKQKCLHFIQVDDD